MPSSKLPAKLVVDANAAMATLLRGQASKVLRESGIAEFATTEFTVQEVRQIIPNVAVRLGLDADSLQRALDVMPVVVYPRSVYAHRIPEAQSRIKDPDDVELLALALELNAPVWTKDDDFKGTGVKRFKTGQLLKLMEEAAREAAEQPPADEEGDDHQAGGTP